MVTREKIKYLTFTVTDQM